MLLAAVVAFGLTTVWFVLVAWLFMLMEQSRIDFDHYEQLYVRLDGVPVIAKGARSGARHELLTLDRQPAKGDTYQILSPAYVAPPAKGASYVSSRDWSVRLASISDGGSPAVYWYLVHDGRTNGRAYGVGYHAVTKQVAGYFSRAGFSERLPPREAWFHVKGDAALAYAVPERQYYEPYWSTWFTQPSQFLLANGKLWRIDMRKRTVAPLVDCPDAEGIGWAWRTADALPQPTPGAPQQASAPRSLFVRTPETALIVDPQSGEVARYPLPAQLQGDSLGVFQLADGRLLIAAYPLSLGKDQLVAWIDPAGKTTKRHVAINAPSRTSDDATVAALSAVAAPAFVWQIVMAAMLAWQKLALGQATSTSNAVGQALAVCAPGMAIVLALSLAGAVAAYRRQRRFGLGGAIGWAVMVFIFGIPGWIAYRLHRTWPVLEECPACDQSSPRDRDACLECGATFPPPELKGVEVFA
ncbi:MAG TPA: hypothetical protein VFV87_16875 [Pirellulaceae bacterium]|nr:hypothetical protein [Pirellulaceae bacterium]